MTAFLQDLASSQPKLYLSLRAGIKKLEDRSRHREPLTQQVDPSHGIFELRVGGKNIARAFFFYQRGQKIIITNGYVKKQQKVDEHELERARQYKRDWEDRHP